MLRVNGIEIEDTFAEAFKMRAARAIVTAETAGWARTAATLATGYATSVIGCDAEAGLEADVPPGETPDGRPGVSFLVFGVNAAALGKALVNRIGQCVMTCPTTACYNGLSPGEETVKVGALLRFFGDGHQASKKLEGRRLIDGEDQEVAARDRALDAEQVLAEKLAVHHGHPPVAPPVELLARLVPVAEEAEHPADLDGLFARPEAVEAGGGRAGHHALADAVDQCLAEGSGVDAEDEKAHSRPAVRRLAGRDVGLEARLGVTADHRGRVPGGQRGGGARPAGRLRGDDGPSRAHLERFGERVLDRHPVHPEHDR